MENGSNHGRKRWMDGLHLALPFLLASFAVLALLAGNADQLALRDGYRSLALANLGALALLLVCLLALRRSLRAGLVAAVLVLLFFSYGHVNNLLRGAPFSAHLVLIPLWLALLALALWIALRRPTAARALNTMLGVTALAALAAPLFTIGGQLYERPRSFAVDSGRSSNATEASIPSNVALPDVYYIIVDEYSRADVLQEYLGYDNHAFLDFLESRGFYVAEASNANYMHTHLSLASSLNMAYLDDLAIDTTGSIFEATAASIRGSRVRQRFESLGYRTAALETGYPQTEIEDADFYLTPGLAPGPAGFNAFEALLFRTTAGVILLDGGMDGIGGLSDSLDYPFRQKRALVLAGFDHLASAPAISQIPRPGPTFFFAHIVSPHWPFVFGPNGEEITPDGYYTLLDPDAAAGEADIFYYNPQSYLDQLTFINHSLEQVIDDILAGSSQPPIIILQSDHGLGIGVDWADPGEGVLRARSGVLNAYYLPAECRQQLYPTISPVNSFRLVLSCAFGEHYELLGDRTYWSLRTESDSEFVLLSELEN